MGANRKFETERRHRSRRRYKIYFLPTLAALTGIVLRVGWGYAPVDVLLDNASALIDLLLKRDTIEIQHPWLFELLSWIASPVALFLSTLLIVEMLDRLGALDWLFPDSPAFVFVDLEAERRLPTEMIGGLLFPFIGRDLELKMLEGLLEDNNGEPFLWRQVSASSGMGKSRLAIEWLSEAERLGWDMGIIDPKDSELLRGWTARKPTALVLDEAETRWRGELEVALERLKAGGSAKRPVRVLVLGQFEPYAVDCAPLSLRDSEVTPAMRLQPLDDAQIMSLAVDFVQPERAAVIAHECFGKPMAASLMVGIEDARSLSEALHRWACHLVPQLRSEGEKVETGLALGICLGALAGPVPLSLAENLYPDFSPIPLRRLYNADRQALLDREVPELRPRDLAQSLALRLLPHISETLRDALFDRLLTEYPERVEAFLREVWTDVSDFAQIPPSRLVVPWPLEALQTRFDSICPDRVKSARLNVEHAKNELGNAKHMSRALSVSDQVIAGCAQRPFDPVLRHIEAMACVEGVIAFSNLALNAPTAFVDLERWGTRLASLAGDEKLGRDREIKLLEAKAIMKAINACGEAALSGDIEAFARLEAWGGRLGALTADAELGRDREIRLYESKAIVNAINAYGTAGGKGDAAAFAGLEAWGNRFSELTVDRELGRDREIRLHEVMAAQNAIISYGEAGVKGDSAAFARLEAWGDRVGALTADAELGRDREIRFHESKAIVNAINAYGTAGGKGDAAAFARLEAWGNRLSELTSDRELGRDREIRFQEAMAISNAIVYYGDAGARGDAKAFARLEAWGVRLSALVADTELGRDLEIRRQEALAIRNAIAGFTKAGARGDAKAFARLEAWGVRLSALVADIELGRDREIRLQEAVTISNAIAGYFSASERGDATALVHLEAWGARLSALVANTELGRDLEIRRQEAFAIRNAIAGCASASERGDATALVHLEAWGARLSALVADTELGRDREIRFQEVMAALNAILGYGGAGLHGCGAEILWRNRLALLAQLFRWDLEVQSVARSVNLAWSDQEKRNWPYGSITPHPISRLKPEPTAEPIPRYRPIWCGPLWFEKGFGT